MNEVVTKLINLPIAIHAFTVRTPDGDFCICINARLGSTAQLQAYKHELKHIGRDDLYKRGSADLIEIYAHRF